MILLYGKKTLDYLVAESNYGNKLDLTLLRTNIIIRLF